MASDTHAAAADLVGMDTHRDELLELIREDKDHPESEQLKVISIVGFGGLGKTVLARQVYDCAGVRDQYEPRIWVRASEKGAVDVLKDILQHVPVAMETDDCVDEQYKQGSCLRPSQKVLQQAQGRMQVDDGNCDVSKLIAGLKECLQSKRYEMNMNYYPHLFKLIIHFSLS
jgi:hypothetical protein